MMIDEANGNVLTKIFPTFSSRPNTSSDPTNADADADAPTHIHQLHNTHNAKKAEAVAMIMMTPNQFLPTFFLSPLFTISHFHATEYIREPLIPNINQILLLRRRPPATP